VADTPPGKIKALHRVDARQKKNPVITGRVGCFLFGRLKQGAEKPEEKQKCGQNHSLHPPFYTTLKRL
jgi:hypothetical protein